MNKREQAFYNFLTTVPEVVFHQWLNNASPEELDLAERLFDEVKFAHIDKINDVSEAKDILKRFTLKANHESILGYVVKYKDEPGAGYGQVYVNAGKNPFQAIQMARAMYGRLLMSESANPVY